MKHFFESTTSRVWVATGVGTVVIFAWLVSSLNHEQRDPWLDPKSPLNQPIIADYVMAPKRVSDLKAAVAEATAIAYRMTVDGQVRTPLALAGGDMLANLSSTETGSIDSLKVQDGTMYAFTSDKAFARYDVAGETFAPLALAEGSVFLTEKAPILQRWNVGKKEIVMLACPNADAGDCSLRAYFFATQTVHTVAVVKRKGDERIRAMDIDEVAGTIALTSTGGDGDGNWGKRTSYGLKSGTPHVEETHATEDEDWFSKIDADEEAAPSPCDGYVPPKDAVVFGCVRLKTQE